MHTMSFLDKIFNNQAANQNQYYQQPIDFSNAGQDNQPFVPQNSIPPTQPQIPQPIQQPVPQNFLPQQQNTYQPAQVPFQTQSQPFNQQPQPIQNNNVNNKPNSFNRQAVAKWILDEKKMQNIDAMVGMAAGIVPIIASVFWGIAGLFLGGILSAYFIYRFISAKKDVTYIKQTYGL